MITSLLQPYFRLTWDCASLEIHMSQHISSTMSWHGYNIDSINTHHSLNRRWLHTALWNAKNARNWFESPVCYSCTVHLFWREPSHLFICFWSLWIYPCFLFMLWSIFFFLFFFKFLCFCMYPCFLFMLCTFILWVYIRSIFPYFVSSFFVFLHVPLFSIHVMYIYSVGVSNRCQVWTSALRTLLRTLDNTTHISFYIFCISFAFYLYFIVLHFVDFFITGLDNRWDVSDCLFLRFFCTSIIVYFLF